MIVGKLTSTEKAKIIKEYMDEHKDLTRVVVIGDKIPEIMPDEILAKRERAIHQDPKHTAILDEEYFNCGDIIYCTPRAVTYYIVMYKLISLLSKGTLLVLNNIVTPDSTPILVDNATLTYGTILKLVRIISPKLIFQDSFTNNGGINDVRLLFRLSKNGIYSTVVSPIKPFNVVFQNANIIEDVDSIIKDHTFSDEDVKYYVDTVSAAYPGMPTVRKALETYKNILVKNNMLDGKKDFLFDMNKREILYRDPHIKVTEMIINHYKYMHDICKLSMDQYANKVTLEEEMNSLVY